MAVRIDIAASILLILSLPPDSLSADETLRCEEIKQKIRLIQSKMRAGYTRAEGEKMEAELRRLRALRRKACR